MNGKGYGTQKKGSGGKHVQLREWVQASLAWATMKPGPRALYVEIRRRFTGSNNGRIILSHRDAAKALAVHRNTVGPYFDELVARGFIRMTQAPYLGPSGIGQAPHWALEEEMTDDMKPASKSFMSWRLIQKPRTKNRTPRHGICDAERQKGPD